MLVKPLIVALKGKEDQIGYCISSQILTIQSINEKTKQLQTDFVAKLGVCWEDEDKRCPAIQYYDAEDLVWFDIVGLTDEEENEMALKTGETASEETTLGDGENRASPVPLSADNDKENTQTASV